MNSWRNLRSPSILHRREKRIMKWPSYFVSDLIHCTNEPNVSIPQLANLLIERSQNTNWVVVFKALITVHHLMCYGNEVSNLLNYLWNFLNHRLANGGSRNAAKRMSRRGSVDVPKYLFSSDDRLVVTQRRAHNSILTRSSQRGFFSPDCGLIKRNDRWSEIIMALKSETFFSSMKREGNLSNTYTRVTWYLARTYYIRVIVTLG